MPDDVSRGRDPAAESWLVLLLGLSIPFAAFPLATWRGFALDPPHVAAALLLLAALFRAWSRRPLPRRALLYATILLAVVSLTGIARIGDAGFHPSGFFKTGAHLVFMLLVFLAVATSGASRRRSLLAALAALAALIALYGIYQAWAIPRGWHSGVGLLSRFSVRPLRISGYSEGVYRATGPFEEPSWLANYLLDAAVYTFFLALDGPTRRSRAGWSLATIFLFGGLFATGSLGGIAAGAVLMLVFAGVVIARLEISAARKLAFVVFVAFVAGGILLGLRQTRFGKALAHRAVLAADELFDGGAATAGAPSLRDDEALTGSAYFESARYSLCLWREAPLFGVGLGQYHSARDRIPACSRFDATNPWTGLAWCAETGLAGLIGLLGLLLAVSAPRGKTPAAATGLVLARLLVLAFLLKQTHSGSYINLSSWYPLGIAAAAGSGFSRRTGYGSRPGADAG